MSQQDELKAEYSRYLIQYYYDQDFTFRPMSFEEWDAVEHDYEE